MYNDKLRNMVAAAAKHGSGGFGYVDVHREHTTVTCIHYCCEEVQTDSHCLVLTGPGREVVR